MTHDTWMRLLIFGWIHTPESDPERPLLSSFLATIHKGPLTGYRETFPHYLLSLGPTSQEQNGDTLTLLTHRGSPPRGPIMARNSGCCRRAKSALTRDCSPVRLPNCVEGYLLGQ